MGVRTQTKVRTLNDKGKGLIQRACPYGRAGEMALMGKGGSKGKGDLQGIEASQPIYQANWMPFSNPCEACRRNNPVITETKK